MAREISQILAQAFCAYEQNPRLEIYTPFVLRIDGSTMQLSTATIHRVYMEELSEGRPLSQNLRLCRSEPYDLLDPGRRKDALRLLIGIIRFLEATHQDCKIP
jgi:hypothetical protein